MPDTKEKISHIGHAPQVQRPTHILQLNDGALFERSSDIHIEILIDRESASTVDPKAAGHADEPKYRLGECLFFPGPVSLSNDEDRADIEGLVQLLIGRSETDFMIDVRSWTFRVQKSDRAVSGIWYRLRRVLRFRPTLQSLPSRLGDSVESALLCPELTAGGLILVLGSPGSGKTTTASSVVASRLQKYGGYAYTIEDPPEILGLGGRHGPCGYCVQNHVHDGDDGWEKSIKQVLRSQPLATPLILLVGEIRSPEAARMMVRAASSGFLVITTSFAFDMISGIDAMLHLCGPDYATTLSHVFRVAVFQKMIAAQRPFVRASHIKSVSGSSRIAVMIRSGKVTMIQDEVQMHQWRS